MYSGCTVVCIPRTKEDIMGKPSTSEDPDIVRAAGEGMTRRHSPHADAREEREAAAEKQKGEKSPPEA